MHKPRNSLAPRLKDYSRISPPDFIRFCFHQCRQGSDTPETRNETRGISWLFGYDVVWLPHSSANAARKAYSSMLERYRGVGTKLQHIASYRFVCGPQEALHIPP